MELATVNGVFEVCMRDAQVFDRDVPGGSLFETETLRKERRKWLVVAAGIADNDAARVFSGSSARAERATIPLNVLGGGQASLLFVLRPLGLPVEKRSTLARLAHFAPGDDVPLVEMREAYLRLSDLPGSDNGLNHLRWELDLVAAHDEPLEEWAQPWKSRIHSNPAHPPSHLHVNSPTTDARRAERGRMDDSRSELRLAVGIPNPLAMLLSLAAWIRQQ